MIPYLKKGDKIAITCPAKKLPRPMDPAVKILQDWGLEVIIGETLNASYHQFAGDDDLRAKDMQRFVDDDSIKAIIAARGGYGTIRIIDDVDFSALVHYPKWVVGFSDITILHSHIHANYGLHTIHGQMPVNVPDASSASLTSLRKALFGDDVNYAFSSHTNNRSGIATAPVIGGNLSLLIAVLGSVSDMDYDGKILFLEDVGEYLYSVDRMLRTLKRAGKLNNLAGLIVGGFTELKDNDIPFGFTIADMVMEVVKDFDYPVCFDFPAGHIPNNHAIIFGRDMSLNVREREVTASYI
ncbi:S66 peptidase family protein [Mucilaginibacter myungsuensis]|uniref:LD-carboxypeptidase n=1 Tax=Mucilaginibacter myungsuensis TaxID=649104 RepID=A0A929PYF8_9SPHI|nr:LD-carboxypeptidase [Mucilaginibacter myungsuensis]MBE9664129.1 LD-carboxypeptidase [Mucilaginibacter myungsuensis]MDN3601308.1 LD-carboxypeptidase [Mucilaginibacter myungsuensis]